MISPCSLETGPQCTACTPPPKDACSGPAGAQASHRWPSPGCQFVGAVQRDPLTVCDWGFVNIRDKGIASFLTLPNGWDELGRYAFSPS
ncbi:hypothetical protein PITC_044230 [Penicillium italicum]|uniref:Uncharacterized protein n=1 Tax=Penicillium italicum TaxID=40296 RepID=A0A0A2L300_PENIT|nr:hypothetical protein PITC_044230 [Penicillium italicum]